jgi:amino acid transporter
LSTLSLPAHVPSPAIPIARKRVAKLTLWPLIAATFFMVSGGTYGTEEVIHGAGYGRGILILMLLPVLWCLPTAFMIGELSSALPAEGGYYAWVRRGLGNFWGFQEAWLSLAASIFDMAIYPTLFGFYLKQMSPWFGQGNHAILAGLFVVITCAALNLAGIRVVGLTSLWLFFLLSAPFAVIVVMSPFKVGAVMASAAAPATTSLGLLGGILVAMWNYMGWDNASTIAQEVERPQRTYPRAMIAAVVLVSLTYVLPFFAVYLSGIPSSSFAADGSWASIAGQIGGKILGIEWLRFAIVLGGMMSGFGMFNALVMSYSRLPLAMARDGMLPKVFAKTSAKTQVPWVAIVVCATGWALCLGLGFQRLITLDIMLYGASLILEFITLVALRIREPELKRGFRVPGGMPGAILCGVFPFLLMSLALIRGERESVLGVNALIFGGMIIATGFVVYFAKLRRRAFRPVVVEDAEAA